MSIVVKLHGRYARLSRTGQRDLFVMSLSLLPLQAEGNSPFSHTRPVSSHRGYIRLLLSFVRVNGGHSRLYLTPLALPPWAVTPAPPLRAYQRLALPILVPNICLVSGFISTLLFLFRAYPNLFLPIWPLPSATLYFSHQLPLLPILRINAY